MRTLILLYSAYGLFIFGLIFAFLLPFFLVAIFIPRFEHWTGTLNWLWAKGLFFFLFLNRSRIEYEEPLDPKQRYILGANHFSYLDIPTMGLIHHNFKFIGKHSLKNVPIFGYMYSKLHVLVDRANFKDRYASFQRARLELHRGFSMAFFPEGGIYTKNPPQMVRFKEGCFRLAVDEQIPVVPVTIHRNHILLPDGKPLMMHRGLVSLKVHKPINPEGTDDEAVKKLKETVWQVIDEEIKRTNP